MPTLYFDTHNALFLINGLPPVQPLLCKKGETIDVFCQPETRNKSCCAPIFVKIFIGEQPHLNSDLLYYIDCGDGIYFLSAHKALLSSNATLDIVAQQHFYFEPNHTVTVYNDFSGHICVETDKFFYSASCPLVASSTIQAKNTQNGTLFIILSQLYNGKKSLVICEFNDDYCELLNEIADDIDFLEEGITVTKCFVDMQSHTTTILYSYQNNTYVSEKISCKRRGCRFVDELLPYAFLEAVIAEDDDEIEGMLDADLRQPLSTFSRFFGKFNIAQMSFLSYIPYCVPLIIQQENSSNYILKRYNFTVSNHRIVDITTI